MIKGFFKRPFTDAALESLYKLKGKYHTLDILASVSAKSVPYALKGGDIDVQQISTSLAVQWLRHCASTAGDAGSIPGQGTKILHAVRCSQKGKNKKEGISNRSFCNNRSVLLCTIQYGSHKPHVAVEHWKCG